MAGLLPFSAIYTTVSSTSSLLRPPPPLSPLSRPHIGIRSDFQSDLDHLSATVSVGTTLGPYGIAYRRVLSIRLEGLLKSLLFYFLRGTSNDNV